VVDDGATRTGSFLVQNYPNALICTVRAQADISISDSTVHGIFHVIETALLPFSGRVVGPEEEGRGSMPR
jgi:hypothetical protein